MDNLLFRCSSWGALFTDPRTKTAKEAGELSVGAKKETFARYQAQKYNRHKFLSNKFVEKGLGVEEDSITLYSRVTKTFLKKNAERLTNEFITGLPDVYIGASVLEAEKVIDIKSSWDVHTFGNAIIDEINDTYFAQGQGYMALTGAKEFHLVYCLVDTPEVMLNDQKRKLAWQMGLIDETESKLYMEACDQIDHEGTFGDIPMAERVHVKVIQRDDDYIQEGYERVKRARKWLSEEFLPSLKNP